MDDPCSNNAAPSWCVPEIFSAEPAPVRARKRKQWAARLIQAENQRRLMRHLLRCPKPHRVS